MNRPLPSTRRRLPSAALLLFVPVLAALLFGYAACKGEEDPAGRDPAASSPLDLLARRPDLVLDEPGLLLPNDTLEWGEYGLTGWYRQALPHPDPEIALFVPTNQPVAALDLPATGPADRDIELQIWVRDEVPAHPALIDLRLNGVDIKKDVPLTGRPQLLRVHTPGLQWQAGANLLEIEAQRYSTTLPDGKTTSLWHTVCLSRVTYGTPRGVELPGASDRRLRLSASTGARYLVETRPPARVELHGAASVPGTLQVRFGFMDPEAGHVEDAGRAPQEIAVGAEALATSVSIPADLEGVLQLDLTWLSEAGGELALDRLAVVEAQGAPRPSVVFISIDTFAASHLAMYDYDRETTPNLERLRREAVTFDHCVANAPWTLPSYLSVLTGLYPHAHETDVKKMEGLDLNSYDLWQVADNRWTMAEMLRGRGYQTAGFVDTAWLLDKFRVAQGFDLYDTDAALPALSFGDPTNGIIFITTRLAPWLDARDPASPFFLFVHALDAHGPYWPEFPFKYHHQADIPATPRMELTGGDYQTGNVIPAWMAATLTGPLPPASFLCYDHPEPRDVPNVCMDHEVPRPLTKAAFPREQNVEEIIARYDESLRKVDHYIQVILDMLDARGMYDDTMIVVTGDHGESFDHGYYGHGRLWEDIVHVPLLIKMPGARFAGRRVTQSVELVDLYPTMLEVAGGGPTREYLHGRSLVPLMRGEETPPRATFSEGGHHEGYMVELDGWKLVHTWPGRESGEPTLLTHRRVPKEWLHENLPILETEALTHERWQELRAQPDFGRKLAELRKRIEGPFDELYHLTEDPGELHDLSAERPDMVERLKALMVERRGRGAAAREQASWSSFVPVFDKATLDALGELGYGKGSDQDD